ncbi:MAG: hypothetical protein HY556_09570 [Euryarchaeota archaeon]|nr:hypothetical protein [Euryarchaeota archaeon]
MFEALTVAAAVITVVGVVFGQDLMGRSWRFLNRTRPLLQVSILPEPDGSWIVRAVVSIPLGKPPLQLYTIRGTIEPTDKASGFIRRPVLLENGPGPTPVVVEQYQYAVRHLPLPPRGKPYNMTINLVAVGVNLTHSYEIIHDGGWRRRKNWFAQQVQDWRARRFFKRARIV